MGLRFRKSIKIAPGIKLNLSTKGAGVSFGGKGCRYSISSSGRKTATVGIPGTGIHYSASIGNTKKKKYSSRSSSQTTVRQISAQNNVIEQQNNAQLVADYNSYINSIKTVHASCGPDINWKSNSALPEPFKQGDIGPTEKNAIEQLNSFKPTFIEKIFGKDGAKRKAQLETAILNAREQDINWHSSWQESVEFANRVLTGDLDAYYAVIEESNPFEKLVDWGSGFEFGTDNPKYMEVEFTVKSKEVIPNTAKSLTKTGKLSEKALTKTLYFDYTQDYVCSCSIRIARELFAILPVNTVIVHATDLLLDTTTGHDEEETILSVVFNRNGFGGVDFTRIDASDFTQTFTHNMKFKKTSGFNPVERLTFTD